MTIIVLVALASIPLLIAFVIAALRDPLRYALPPYAVFIPFSSLISVGPGAFGSVSSLLGLLLGVTLIFQLVTTRRSSRQLSPTVPIWLAFLALAGFSVFWSIAPFATIDDVIVLASQVVLFVALALTRFDRAALQRFETAIVVGGVLVVCYGLAQLIFLGGLPTGGSGSGRFGEDLLGANNQAAALLLPVALTAHRAISGDPRRRVLYTVLSLQLLFGIAMTGSRGGLVAVVVVLVCVLLFSEARRSTVVALLSLAVVLFALVFVVNPGGVGERQVSRAENSSGRSDIWAVGLHSCQTYCATGAGWGTFPTVYRSELASVPEARVLVQGVAYEPHNIFILAGIETGVVGLLLVIAGLWVALRGAWRMPRWLRGPPLAALLGTIVSSFFLSNLEFKFFWAVLAYAAITESMAVETRRRNSPPVPEAAPAGIEPVGKEAL